VATATPQASQTLRFEAIIPLKYSIGLLARKLFTQMRKDRNPRMQGHFLALPFTLSA
jgi:hypothetical protein